MKDYNFTPHPAPPFSLASSLIALLWFPELNIPLLQAGIRSFAFTAKSENNDFKNHSLSTEIAQAIYDR
jgi:hypothetical protein